MPKRDVSWRPVFGERRTILGRLEQHFGKFLVEIRGDDQKQSGRSKGENSIDRLQNRHVDHKQLHHRDAKENEPKDAAELVTRAQADAD